VNDTIRHVLTAYRTWAVVGASPDPYRDSHDIANVLERAGKHVLRVNPHWDEAYPTLEAAAADHDVEVVDVFRRSSEAGAHVDEAVAIGAKAVWLQLGVIDHDAAERAREAGLHVVMDRCPKLELPRLDQRLR
jgi:predicted CoA-binding protein